MNRKPHAHPYESEFDHWARTYRRRQRLLKVAGWIFLVAGCLVFLVGLWVVLGYLLDIYG